jgi:hypothetical protein
LVQNPSVRPARPPRDRPTAAPHSLLPQNRLRSGTSGFSSTAARGSGRGTSGTVTTPAPRRERAPAPVEEREDRTETEREETRPETERDNRPETDRRENCERDEREEREELGVLDELEPEPRELPVPPRGVAVMPVAVAPIMP